MYKKRALVLWAYLWLIALAACGPKVIDDADVVSVEYVYSFMDSSVVERWVQHLTIGANNKLNWMENVIMWARQDDVFTGQINWKDVYISQYDQDLTQTYTNVIMKEVFWIENPMKNVEVFVDTFGTGIIVDEVNDNEWYPSYLVDFNDPKTYSDLNYTLKIIDIEKK